MWVVGYAASKIRPDINEIRNTIENNMHFEYLNGECDELTVKLFSHWKWWSLDIIIGFHLSNAARDSIDFRVPELPEMAHTLGFKCPERYKNTKNM